MGNVKKPGPECITANKRVVNDGTQCRQESPLPGSTGISACHADKMDFFDSIVPLVRPMAERLNVNEDLLLTVVAFEDTWGQDQHNKKLHNIFGITKAGGNNIKFSSYKACVDFWEAHYGPRVKGIQTLEQFITAMRKIGYNSVNIICLLLIKLLQEKEQGQF